MSFELHRYQRFFSFNSKMKSRWSYKVEPVHFKVEATINLSELVTPLTSLEVHLKAH